jgi:hypothetical protein
MQEYTYVNNFVSINYTLLLLLTKLESFLILADIQVTNHSDMNHLYFITQHNIFFEFANHVQRFPLRPYIFK